jgi:ribonuclease HII
LTFVPTLDWETAVSPPYIHVAGLDEAGRGALAGPVTAAAVIFPLDNPQLLDALQGVNDSKQLSAQVRQQLFSRITHHAATYAVASVSAAIIDQIGIVPATKQAMMLALAQLAPAAGYLLIDGLIRLPNCPLPQQAIIRGDSHSLSIAAASILAKVTRDREMIALGDAYPQYGFARHKGYGTAAHLAAIDQYGPSPVHRHTFAPMRQTLFGIETS